MALQTLSWGTWPAPAYWDSAPASMLLDASGEKAAAIWRVGHTGNIRKLHFRLLTVTTGDTLRASLQDVDTATGDPDGTADQSGTVVVADGDDNTWKTVTLGADRAVTRGDWCAAVIDFNSYVAGNLNVARENVQGLASDVGYTDQFTASWTKQSRQGIVAVEYDDGAFYPQPGLVSGYGSSVTYASNTAGADEYGMLFSLPFPVRVAGVGFYSSLTADADLVLYDSDGVSALQTSAWDVNLQSGTALVPRQMFFPSSQELLANTTYRVALKPTTTSAITLRTLEMFSAAARGQLPGGTNIQLTKRVDAGSWTDVDTQRPAMWLLLDGADDGASAGGLLRHPGMTGGLAA